jgi:nucleoside-diphosphate-sugar epimerase
MPTTPTPTSPDLPAGDQPRSRAVHVVVGAGPVGTATALLLAGAGHDVRVLTRSGGGPDHPLVTRIRVDAADAGALRNAAQGATAIYNCVNPPYQHWDRDWPPIATAMLAATEATGAVLATVSNLYGYGPIDGEMTEDTPLAATGTKGRVRAQMWLDALDAHRAGRARVTEVRGADYFGPGVTDSSLGERVVPRVLAGKGVRVLGDPDAVRSWTYVPDVARLLVAVAADEQAWGRAWHVPSAPPMSSREIVGRLCATAGVEPVKVGTIPNLMLTVAGLAVPVMRALKEVVYQFDRPFVMSSSAARATFGLAPTPVDEALRATVDWYRGARSERRAADHAARSASSPRPNQRTAASTGSGTAASAS